MKKSIMALAVCLCAIPAAAQGNIAKSIVKSLVTRDMVTVARAPQVRYLMFGEKEATKYLFFF